MQGFQKGRAEAAAPQAKTMACLRLPEVAKLDLNGVLKSAHTDHATLCRSK